MEWRGVAVLDRRGKDGRGLARAGVARQYRKGLAW